MSMIKFGYAAIRNFFTANRPSEWRLVDKEEAESTVNGKREGYEVQRLVFDGCKLETRWQKVATLRSYDAACAVEAIEKAKEPVGSCVVNIGFHREVLGWRIIRVTQETWKRTAVIQLKSEVINNGNPNKEVR